MALTIGQVAKRSGIAAKTIRFYEAAGVLPPPGRTASGYRQYTTEGLQHLLFVRRARMLGLSLRHLKSLMVVRDGGARRPVRGQVHEVIRTHLFRVQAQIRELRLLQRELERVLRGIETATAHGPAGHCRCLDAVGKATATSHHARRR